MDKRKLRVGIAGFGVVGKRRQKFIDEHPAMEIVAVCDVAFEETGSFEDGVVFHPNYQALLEEELDILFVCLPNFLAAQATIAGLERGLHVFCEKPPGRNLEDIVRVRECEQRHPELRLKYGFNHRYHDSIREALSIIRSGELGRVINMRGVYGKSKIISFDSDWRTERRFAGGGILLDQGIHMVDMMRLFAGDFIEVHSMVSNSHWEHDVEDNAYALLRTTDGVVSMLHSSATEWRHLFRLEITLSQGQLILEGILSGSKSYGAETLTVVNHDGGEEGDSSERMIRYDHDPSWKDEVHDFADVVLSGGKVTEGSSLDALRTMQLVYRIYCADPEWKTRFQLTANLPEGFESEAGA